MKYNTDLKKVVELLRTCNGSCVVFTGAGMSAESGIPTFRDKGGFWEKYDPNVYANIDTFRSHPEKPWQMMRAM